MTNYLQIQGDPMTWWPTQPVQAAQLTEPTLTVTIQKPLVYGILVISTRAASIMLVSNEGVGGPVPSDVDVLVESIYLPTAAGPSAGSTGYELPAGTNLVNLASEIATLMTEGQRQALPLGGAPGAVLMLNGATLPFVVLAPVHVSGGLGQPSGGGPVPSD